MSNTSIFSITFFLLLLTFSHCSSKFNEMTTTSLNEFIEDIETCYNIEDPSECLETSSLQKKGDVASKCCGVQVKTTSGTSAYCINLSNNKQVQNYILYLNAHVSNSDVKYSCESGGSLETFQEKDGTEDYEKLNYELISAMDANTVGQCFTKANGFKYANGCCFVKENCACFSDGISKNELDVFLALNNIETDLENEIFYCKDENEEKNGTYKELFEKKNEGRRIQLSGVFLLLLMFINLNL